MSMKKETRYTALMTECYSPGSKYLSVQKVSQMHQNAKKTRWQIFVARDKKEVRDKVKERLHKDKHAQTAHSRAMIK